MIDYQIPPLSIEDRARFLLQRYCEYRDALTESCGVDVTAELKLRFKQLANQAAFEDLQALLGRRGPNAIAIELTLRKIEADIAAEAAAA